MTNSCLLKRCFLTSGGLSKAEIERMVKEGERNKAKDVKRRQEIELKGELEQGVYKARDVLSEFGDKVTQEDKDKLEALIKEVEGELSD